MTHRRHRLFGRLAFVAMLLLASVPTLGRLAAPTHDGPHPPHHAMPGMAMPGTPQAPGLAQATPPLPPRPAHQHDDDCAYCALLGAAVPTAASTPWLSQAPLPDFAPRPWRAPPQRALPPGALGSRGPPTRA